MRYGCSSNYLLLSLFFFINFSLVMSSSSVSNCVVLFSARGLIISILMVSDQFFRGSIRVKRSLNNAMFRLSRYLLVMMVEKLEFKS